MSKERPDPVLVLLAFRQCQKTAPRAGLCPLCWRPLVWTQLGLRGRALVREGLGWLLWPQSPMTLAVGCPCALTRARTHTHTHTGRDRVGAGRSRAGAGPSSPILF